MSRRKKKAVPPGGPAPARSGRLIPLALVAALVVVGGALAWRFLHPENYAGHGGPPANTSANHRFQLEAEAKVFAGYAGSASCHECHPQAFEKWQNSHHGLAERKIAPQLDRVAFEPKREIKSGTQTSEARAEGDQLQLITAGLKSPRETFTPGRVIGVDPLRQFLIPAGRGHWQTAELTWDPRKSEWINVLGNEDRQHGDWPHR